MTNPIQQYEDDAKRQIQAWLDQETFTKAFSLEWSGRQAYYIGAIGNEPLMSAINLAATLEEYFRSKGYGLTVFGTVSGEKTNPEWTFGVTAGRYKLET